MKSKFLTWVSALGVVALVGGALVVTANAQIGAGSSPLATEAPDLLTTTIDGDDVLFCFDENLDDDDLGAADLFEVRGYDEEATSEANDVDVNEDDGDCVDATIDTQDRALEDYTIGTVQDGAVEDDDGNQNVEQSAPLAGSTENQDEGHTAAPNLVSADNDDDDIIIYEFDQDVDCDAGEGIDAAGDAAAFAYYESDGTRVNGTAITDCDGNEVEVDFTGSTANEAERFVIDNKDGNSDNDDASTDEVGQANGDIGTEQNQEGDTSDNGPRNTSWLEHVGEDTALADLTDAERTDDDEVTYNFDEQLDDNSENEADFYVLTEDGTRYDADDCAITGADDQDVECTFDPIADAADNEVVMAAVDEGAVQDDDNTDDNSIGDAPIGTSASPGFTDGPDLEDCVYSETDETIDFIFDEEVNEGSVDDTDLEAVDQDGDESESEDIDDIEANVVTARFDQSVIEDAVGCNVDDESLADVFNDNDDGNQNSAASIGRGGGSGSTTTATSVSTSTSTTSVTSTVTDSPRTINAPTSLTISYKGRPKFKAAFKGKVGNRFAKCEAGRLVKLKKNGKNSGQTTSKADGSWKIRKKGKAARGRFQATAARKVFTRGNGDTVVCGKGESKTLSR